MTPAGCHRVGSWERAMTVSARLRCFGSGTLVAHIVISLHACSTGRISCWLSKLSSLILDDEVDTQRSSLSLSLISQSAWSSSCLIDSILQTLAISNSILEGWVGCWIICWEWQFTVFLNVYTSALSRCDSSWLCELWFLTWLAIRSMLMRIKWSWRQYTKVYMGKYSIKLSRITGK